jgi:uncharacterized protein DUF3618
MTSDPDRIRLDIETTRRELSADVDALTEKVDPRRVVHRRTDRARGALSNLRETVMGGASTAEEATRDTLSSVQDSTTSSAATVSDAASSAPEMIRGRTEGNPLAAGLMAFGAGWLVSSLIPASQPEQDAATQVQDAVREHGQPVAEDLATATQEVKEGLREPARQAAESLKGAATEATATVKQEVRSAASDVTRQAGQTKDTIADQAGTSQQ